MRTSYAGMLMLWAGLAGCGAESPRSATGPDPDPTESGGGRPRTPGSGQRRRIPVPAGHVGGGGATRAESRPLWPVAPTVCDAGFDPDGSARRAGSTAAPTRAWRCHPAGSACSSSAQWSTRSARWPAPALHAKLPTSAGRCEAWVRGQDNAGCSAAERRCMAMEHRGWG